MDGDRGREVVGDPCSHVGHLGWGTDYKVPGEEGERGGGEDGGGGRGEEGGRGKEGRRRRVNKERDFL